MTDKCDWLPCWEQIIPASSPWLQLWMPIPLWGQTSRAVSFPLQPNSSRKMGPVPRPKFDPIIPFIKLLWVVAIASASWANKQALLYVCMYGSKHVHHIKTMLITSRLHGLPLVDIPSCLHTTIASVSSHPSSHTVPQLPLWQISTRPSYSFLPPTSRTSELLQTGAEGIQLRFEGQEAIRVCLEVSS